MNVSACIATRGDVDTAKIAPSLPAEWEILLWDNKDGGNCFRWKPDGEFTIFPGVGDLGPHARFAAIEYASHDLIYVQDDDVIVSDPQAIVDAYPWEQMQDWPDGAAYLTEANAVVCNMPPEFRPHYPDSAMVGFGACFHRGAPERAFRRFFDHWPKMQRDDPLFLRESCRIFTALTPRVLINVPKQDMQYASYDNRLWRQGDHVFMREAALRMAREVRDT